MTARIRHTVTLGPAAALAAFALLCAPPAGAASSPQGETLAPLPSSDYSVRSVCSAPTWGDAACLAMELVPQTAAARAHSHPLGVTLETAGGNSSEPCEKTPPAKEGCLGLRPQDLHSAYELPETAPASQTIAIVDAYNDPTAEADLKAYDEEFKLPACTAGDGCFEQVNQSGKTGEPPFPKTSKELEAHEGVGSSRAEREEAENAEGWIGEISLDIEAAHAVCQNECKILLVEASSPTLANLDAAEETAVAKGATEVSNSWGSPECAEEHDIVKCLTDSSAFDHPGVVITAAAGDTGYLNWAGSEPGYPSFPASSPQVVAVGGTRLKVNTHGQREAETVWNDAGKDDGVIDGSGASGGGCSEQFEAEPWQQHLFDWSDVGCVTRRAVADVAADADPYTGLAVYDSSNRHCEAEGVAHWCTVGGTSLASPLIAAVFALAGGAHGIDYPAQTLYVNEGYFHDVTEGSNGECDKPSTGSSACTPAEEAAASCRSYLICLAGPGYDGPTGVGTPAGVTGFAPPAGGDGEETGFAGPGEEAVSESGEASGNSGSGVLLPPPPPNGGPVTPVGTSSSGGPAPGPAAESISALGLTRKAIKALDTSRPRISQLGFTFTSSRQTIVRVSLQRLVARHRRERWQAQGGGLEIAVSSGPNAQALGGHAVLHSGTYRLTVTPVGGTARTIEFEIG